MSFLTVLEKIGQDIAKIFTEAEPVINEIQTVATPFENVFMPGLSAMIQTGLTAIYNTEAMAALAGKQTGSGAVKLSAVIATIAPQIAPDLKAIGVTAPTNTQYTNFISALVQAANAFQISQTPSLATTPVASTISTPAVAASTGAVVK